jgi:hypothetical protein
VNYLVLHVRPYDFKDKDSGRRVQGASLTYLDLEVPPSSQDGERGYAPIQLTIDVELVPAFTVAPGFYDLSFGQRRGLKGRPQLTLAKAKLEAPVDLTQLVELSLSGI